MTSEGARDRLAELSATAWVTTASGVAVELGLPAPLREPVSARELADAMGIPVALARSLAEALVAGGLAQRADDGLVAAPGLVELVEGARYQFPPRGAAADGGLLRRGHQRHRRHGLNAR